MKSKLKYITLLMAAIMLNLGATPSAKAESGAECVGWCGATETVQQGNATAIYAIRIAGCFKSLIADQNYDIEGCQASANDKLQAAYDKATDDYNKCVAACPKE